MSAFLRDFIAWCEKGWIQDLPNWELKDLYEKAKRLLPVVQRQESIDDEIENLLKGIVIIDDTET